MAHDDTEVRICNKALVSIGAETLDESFKNVAGLPDTSDVNRLAKLLYPKARNQLQFKHQWRFTDYRYLAPYIQPNDFGWGGEARYRIPHEDTVGPPQAGDENSWAYFFKDDQLLFQFGTEEGDLKQLIDTTRTFSLSFGFRKFEEVEGSGITLINIDGLFTLIMLDNGDLEIKTGTGVNEVVHSIEDVGVNLNPYANNFVGVTLDPTGDTFTFIPNLDFSSAYTAAMGTGVPATIDKITLAPSFDALLYDVRFAYTSGDASGRTILDAPLDDGRFNETTRVQLQSETPNTPSVWQDKEFQTNNGEWRLTLQPVILRTWGIWDSEEAMTIDNAQIDEERWEVKGGEIYVDQGNTVGVYAQGSALVSNTEDFPQGFITALESLLAAMFSLPITQSDRIQTQQYALHNLDLETVLPMEGMQGRNKIITNRRLSNSRSGGGVQF